MEAAAALRLAVAAATEAAEGVARVAADLALMEAAAALRLAVAAATEAAEGVASDAADLAMMKAAASAEACSSSSDGSRRRSSE